MLGSTTAALGKKTPCKWGSVVMQQARGFPWACGPPTRCGTNSDCGASGRSPVRDTFAAGPVVTLWTHLAWPPAVGTPWQRMGSPC